MSAEQNFSTLSDINESKVANSSENQEKIANDNVNSEQTTSKKKAKRSKSDSNVIYMHVEEENEPIHIKIKRIIPKLIDEYVTTYRKPIRRNKLQELVFSYDEELAKFYEEHKEAAVAVFSFAITSLSKEKKIIKVKDPDKKRPTYFILPKHLDMFKEAVLSQS